MPSYGVCVSVCVTFVDHGKTNKRIFKFFHHRVAKPFFSEPKIIALFRRGPPNWGVECKGGMKNDYFRLISRFISEMMQDRAIVTMKGE